MSEERTRAPNIRDVAREAGVSYQTVSRVLNDSERIRDSTRERVQAAIDRLGYRPNQAARALSTNRSRTIGVLSALSAHYGPATAITAIEFAARDAGYRLSITNLRSSDATSISASLDFLLSQSVEALVVIAPQQRVLTTIAELDLRVPYVTLESGIEGGSASMTVDQIAGARAAVGHLAELGHEDILHIAGPQNWIEAEARMTGYLEELDARGLRVRAPILGDWTAAFGYSAGIELLRVADFTAVFAGNDQMALGMMHACREYGLEVPGDVSVVGFDDVPDAAHYSPPLTTVRQDFEELGRRAVGMLLAQLRGVDPGERGMVMPQLVVRESTAPRRR